MRPRLFTLSTYMAPGDAFHIAHKPLSRDAGSALHRHDYFELFIVETGACRHRLSNADVELEAGSVVFIRPDDAHSVAAAGPETCRIVNVMLRSETADHLASRYGDDLSGRFFWAGGPTPVSLLLPSARLGEALRLALGLETGPRSLARIEAFLLALMTDVTDLLPANEAPAMPAWLAQACDAARRPEIYKRGASGLVEAAGRGHEHVCRQMKRHLGLTPSAYVNRIRMDRAAMLLARGEVPLPEIAAEVGLENLSHFHRLFRHHHGLTPRAYRERHRNAPF